VDRIIEKEESDVVNVLDSAERPSSGQDRMANSSGCPLLLRRSYRSKSSKKRKNRFLFTFTLKKLYYCIVS